MSEPGGSGAAARFLTVAEVADLLRLSRMTVYRLVADGELPALRVGKSYRVPQSALDAFIAERMSSGESQAASGS